MTATKRRNSLGSETNDLEKSVKKAKSEGKPETDSSKSQNNSQEPKSKFKSAEHELWHRNCNEILTAAAKRKDPCQSKWPVQLNHCFGRIIMDNTIGIDKPWKEKLKSPAIHHMTQDQAQQCNKVSDAILSGKLSLVDLDEKSLALRGKKSKRRS